MTTHYEIRICSAAGVAELVNFMYGRPTCADLVHCLGDLLTLSSAFDIRLLQRFCEGHMIQNLCVDNAMPYLQIVNDYECSDSLRELVFAFCKDHIAAVSKTPAMKYALRNQSCHPLLADLIEDVIGTSNSPNNE